MIFYAGFDLLSIIDTDSSFVFLGILCIQQEECKSWEQKSFWNYLISVFCIKVSREKTDLTLQNFRIFSASILVPLYSYCCLPTIFKP